MGTASSAGPIPLGAWECLPSTGRSPRMPHPQLQVAGGCFKDLLSPVCPALGYTVSSFSNGFPGCPGEGPRFSAPRRPSTSSLRHPSLGEESTHALIAPDEQVSQWVAAQCLSVGLGEGGGEETWHLLPGRIMGGREADPKKGRQPWTVWRTRKRRKLQL